MNSDIHLTLFFTKGVSLGTWDDAGMLSRELAIYRTLKKQGVAIRFVSYGNKDDNRFVDEINGIEMINNRFNLPIEWYARSLRLAISKREKQIFKSNQILGSDIAMHIAKKKGAHFVARCGYLLSDFELFFHGIDSAKYLAASSLESEVFKEARAIVVTTAKMKTSAVDLYQVDPEKIEVIPNYVQSELFSPQKQNSNIRPKIGFIGRLNVQKNPLTFIESVKGLDVDVQLIGDGPMRAQLEKSAINSKAKITFLGNVRHAELPKIMQSWDVYVLPSLIEGHPKTLIEAMSCGLAVVGTKVSGVKEMISDRKNGLLVELSASAIRNAIDELMGDDQLRIDLGDAARKMVLRKFSLDRIVQMEFDLYSNILSENA